LLWLLGDDQLLNHHELRSSSGPVHNLKPHNVVCMYWHKAEVLLNNTITVLFTKVLLISVTYNKFKETKNQPSIEFSRGSVRKPVRYLLFDKCWYCIVIVVRRHCDRKC